MATSCEKLDLLVKDYLLFRGFSSTLKALDQELKTDKDKGLRVDRMLEQIWSLIAGYDLQGFREYWRYLNQRLFSRLEQRYTPSERKLESSLLKLYIVNAHQSGKQEKVLAFFELMGSELQSHPDFKDWFAFPFVPNPSENPLFSLYFNKQWQDTLQLSLHNFLSVVLQAMPVPTLLNVEFDARRMKTLQEENSSLKKQLLNASASGEHGRNIKPNVRRNVNSEAYPPSSPPDMVFDFSGLANESETFDQEKQKTIRRFPLSLTSPLTGRKKSEPTLVKSKVSVTSSSSTSAASNAGAQGKSKVSDWVSAPTLQNRMQVDTRRSTVVGPPSPSMPSPAASSATVSKQPVTNKQAPAQRHSPAPLVKHSSYTVSDSTNTTTSSSQLASRSLSAPDAKNMGVGRGRLLASDRSPEAQAHPIPVTLSQTQPIPVTLSQTQPTPVALSQTPTASSGAAGTNAELDSHGSLVNYADSPFLLLEDDYHEHGSAASFCRFSSTGQYVASLDVDGVVKVWMWSPQPATTATVMSKSAFLSLAWASKSDKWLLLGNKAGTIRLFDVKDSKTYREVLVNPDNPANCMRVTDLVTCPQNKQFVCATSDLCPITSDVNTVSGRLLQWDFRTLKLERALLVDSTVCTAVTCSSYSQSGHLLLTGGADGSVRIYDSNQQKPVQKWQSHDSPIHTVQFLGDKSVYSMSADGNLHEWSLNKPGQLVNTLSTGARDLGKVNSGSCRGRLFSLDIDNNYLLTYHRKRGAIYKISGVPGPTCVMELKPHQTPVVTVDWSPSPETRACLTSSSDGKIKISTLLSK